MSEPVHTNGTAPTPPPPARVRQARPSTGRPVGRPPKIRVDAARLESQSLETMCENLATSIKPEIEGLRIKAMQQGLAPKELLRCAALARTLDTLARAKRSLIEASKAGDLSGIPAAELARIVCRAMRNDPDLRVAIVAEMRLEAVA